MATHTIGFLLAVVVIWKAFSESDIQSALISSKKQETENKDINTHLAEQTSGRLRFLALPLMGLVLAGILATSQVVLNPSSTLQTGESQENTIGIDYKSVPFVGSPDAPYIINLLFDYKCPHCQKIHFMLDEVVQRYSGKVAFALCPTPLNPHCNPYIPQEADAFKNSCELAHIGLAVWVANSKVFPNFENWMFTYESGSRWRPRTLEATQAKAVELIGQAKLDAAMSSPWIDRYLQTCIEMYGQSLKSGKGGVPRMIFGSKWVIPEAYSADELISIIQESLGVPKP
jgi:protein-disulfide isomerase